MDAGIAAVIGAAIGGGLTGLTALGTGMFGLRTARLQLKTQESEAARQRRFESLQERRGPRSQAYAEFIAAGQEIVDAFHGREPAFNEQYETFIGAIRKRRAVVAIAGPDAVVKAAGEFADEVRRTRNDLVHARGPRRPSLQYRQRIEGRLDAFAKAARTALEDEGHQS
ncbi:hypothetical protein ACFYRJ_22100 [Streptomyces sp. NPDC005531]|uniref:hypothetical protein n=1 Tax=Streptomyces sp. NPDC005531 TaxID=3364722 RepID=UPI0036ACB918